MKKYLVTIQENNDDFILFSTDSKIEALKFMLMHFVIQDLKGSEKMRKYLIVINDNNNLQVLYSTDNYNDALDKQALFKRLLVYQNASINIFVNNLFIARSKRVTQ